MYIRFVVWGKVYRSFCVHRNAVVNRRSKFWKGLCRSSLDFHFKVFFALTFNTVIYENGKPFSKVWNIVIMRERVISDFDTCVRVFWSLLKSILNIRKGIQIRIVSRTISGDESVMYMLKRFVETSIKNFENRS